MAGHVACMADKITVKRTLIKDAGRKILNRISMPNLKYEIQMNLK
jgi:hypothetical protein